MLHQETTPGGLRVIYKDRANIVGVFNDLLISVSRGELRVDFVRTFGLLVGVEAAKLPSKLGVIIVISEDAQAPGAEVREQLVATHRALAGRLRALVRVVEGEGFAAAAKRSVVTLIDLALRHGYPSRVVGRVDDGVTWILEHMDPVQQRKYTVGDVLAAIRALRAQLDKVPRREHGSNGSQGTQRGRCRARFAEIRVKRGRPCPPDRQVGSEFALFRSDTRPLSE